jgi:hypothetical protein
MPDRYDDLNKATREAVKDFSRLFRKHWPRLRDTTRDTFREEMPRVRAAVRKEGPRIAKALSSELRRAAAELRKRSR